jgi:hypothetical protein
MSSWDLPLFIFFYSDHAVARPVANAITRSWLASAMGKETVE